MLGYHYSTNSFCGWNHPTPHPTPRASASGTHLVVINRIYFCLLVFDIFDGRVIFQPDAIAQQFV